MPTSSGSVRLAIASDLHVDHHAEAISLLAEVIRRREPDVLIVAGDLTADGALLERSLAGLRASAKEALFVPGNHDLWCRPQDPSSRERYERIVPAHARAAGYRVPWVEDDVVLFGHRFVGVTGWYDYSLRNVDLDGEIPLSQYEAGNFGVLQWSDKLRIRWPDDEGRLLDDPQICARHVRALARQLERAGTEPIVAVTHHLPFAELVTSKGTLPWDFLNGFMGSAKLGDLLIADPRVQLSISGHTHFARDVIVQRGDARLRALTSPLGYPREYRREGFTLAEQTARRVTFVDL